MAYGTLAIAKFAWGCAYKAYKISILLIVIFNLASYIAIAIHVACFAYVYMHGWSINVVGIIEHILCNIYQVELKWSGIIGGRKDGAVGLHPLRILPYIAN